MFLASYVGTAYMTAEFKDAARLIRQLKLQELRAVAEIARSGSILAAAEAIGTTQPAATRTLASAEAKLGAKLFERGSRGVRPTVFGEAILLRIAAIFSEIRGAADDVAELQGLSAGSLSIGVMPLAAPGLVPEALQRMLAGRPRLRATVIEGNPEFLLAELRMHRIEIIVGRLTLAGIEADLQTEALYEEELCVAARAQHPLHRRRRLALRDLLNELWVLPPPDTAYFNQVAMMFHLTDLTIPSCQIVTLSFPVQIGMVARSDYVSAFPRSPFMLGAVPPTIRPLPVALPRTRGPVGLIRLRSRSNKPVLAEFMASMRAVAAVIAAQKSGFEFERRLRASPE